MRQGYDSTTVNSIPIIPGEAEIVLGYVNGKFTTWPQLCQRFPQAIKIPITVSADTPTAMKHMLDVEWGDATPGQAPDWCRRERVFYSDPMVYCNSSTWPNVRAEFSAQGVREPFYGIAQYDDDSTIPAEWIAMGCIGKQYRSDTKQNLDYWTFVDFIPGVDKSKGDSMDREGLITFAFGALAARDPSVDEINRLTDTTNVSDRAVVLAALDSSDGTAIKLHRRSEAGLK